MTMEVPVSRGLVAVVDDADYQLVSQHTWHVHIGKRTVYARTNVRIENTNGRRQAGVRMHRLILSAQPGQQVDHIDGDGMNNTRANLRFCTGSQNTRNSRKKVNTISKYKGVSWYADRKRWGVAIWINNRNQHLGFFTDETVAARAYDTAARTHFGEFARTNFNAPTQ